MPSFFRTFWTLGAAAALGAGCTKRPAQQVTPVAAPVATLAAPDIHLEAPAEHAVWPWNKARKDSPQRGVTHWLVKSADGTTCDLMRFDFKVNPRLRFELYSQDEDDAKPFDNVVKFWPMGVGQAVRHLNARFKESGPVVAAWNGPFFGYYRSAPIPDETGFHLSPVVLKGKVLYNRTNHRWTFGVKYEKGRPVFKVFHLPGRDVLAREFDFAAGAMQCLIKDGQALKMEPFPRSPAEFRKPPVPSTPLEAGHIPFFDHAKFSRASLAWSRDSSSLYLLFVREPNSDNESASIGALSKWQPQSRGWSVSDVQRFWRAMMKAGLIWNAINSDAGDAGQLAYRLPNGHYELASPLGDRPTFERRVFAPDFKGTPQGGALAYFYVREGHR